MGKSQKPFDRVQSVLLHFPAQTLEKDPEMIFYRDVDSFKTRLHIIQILRDLEMPEWSYYSKFDN